MENNLTTINDTLEVLQASPDITQIPARKPRYTRKNPIPLEKIIALRKKNLHHHEIAKILGCARETVTRRLLEADLEGLTDYENNEATILAHQRRRILSSITEKDLEKASLSQKVISTAVLIEKQRLLEDKSTHNASIHISVEHQRIVQEVIDRIVQAEIDKLRT